MKKKECPSCAMEIDEKSDQCPICGYEFVLPNDKSWVRWVAVMLLILILLFWIF